MKKAILAAFHIFIILIFICIFFSLYSRAVRYIEIQNALELSMKQALAQLQVDEGLPASNEDWINRFVESVTTQIHSQSDLTVQIYAADMEKGLLSAEAILSYRNLIGTESSVTTGKRIIILEQYYDTEQ